MRLLAFTLTFLVLVAAGCGGSDKSSVHWEDFAFDGRSPDAVGHIADYTSKYGGGDAPALLVANYTGDPDNVSVDCLTLQRSDASTLPEDVTRAITCSIDGATSRVVDFVLYRNGDADYAIWKM